MNTIVILCDTLRRDHCSAYTGGQALNRAWSPQQPDWAVPTPNIDRLARRGTLFTNAWCGSHPCMPARRDIYTGRYEFLERGWGPLEEDDLDLPRQVSGPPNMSLQWMAQRGHPVSYLLSDHFHLWEQGAGNYHMGYSGFEFVRGLEGDGWYTDPLTPGKDFACPPGDALGKYERHFRNMHFSRHAEADYTVARVFAKAADWLERNHTQKDFYLHVDCFPPHEPWDPPEDLLKHFEPRGYDVPFEWTASAPYAPWEGRLTPQQARFYQARYAATVLLTDRWLGKLLEVMDRRNLWQNTLLIFCTDHGTYNGDHGRLGKLQTHLHDPISHIPFIVCHPTLAHGQRRDQLVQLVDIYPTVLQAAGRPVPADRHGRSLLPVLESPDHRLRDFAICGQFGRSVSITDGRWILHQSPPARTANRPLYWYGYCLAKFLPYDLGPYAGGRREATTSSWPTETWLSDKAADPNELDNLAAAQPGELGRMQDALREVLRAIPAPPEQAQRLGLS